MSNQEKYQGFVLYVNHIGSFVLRMNLLFFLFFNVRAGNKELYYEILFLSNVKLGIKASAF